MTLCTIFIQPLSLQQLLLSKLASLDLTVVHGRNGGDGDGRGQLRGEREGEGEEEGRGGKPAAAAARVKEKKKRGHIISGRKKN